MGIVDYSRGDFSLQTRRPALQLGWDWLALRPARSRHQCYRLRTPHFRPEIFFIFHRGSLPSSTFQTCLQVVPCTLFISFKFSPNSKLSTKNGQPSRSSIHGAKRNPHQNAPQRSIANSPRHLADPWRNHLGNNARRYSHRLRQEFAYEAQLFAFDKESSIQHEINPWRH